MPRENIGGYWRPQFFDQGDRFWLLSALSLGGAKVDIIQSGRYPFEKRHTYALPLERAERAIHMLAAHGKGVNPVHLAVVPGAPKVNV